MQLCNIWSKHVAWLALLAITFIFLLSPDFYELWHEDKKRWAMLVLGWVTVCVLGQVWDVSDSKFVFDVRLSKNQYHFLYLYWLLGSCQPKHFSTLFSFISLYNTFLNLTHHWSIRFKQQNK